MPEYKIDPDMAREALLAQDACNLSGIVFAMARACQEICEEAKLRDQDTAWKNRHPVMILYADKLAELTGCLRSQAFHDAYEACKAACVPVKPMAKADQEVS